MNKNMILAVVVASLFFVACEEKQTITEDNLAKKTDKSKQAKTKAEPKETIFNFKTTDGKDIKVAVSDDGWKFQSKDYENKIVLLDFFATWCPPCIRGIPHLNEITNKYKEDVVVLGLEIGKRGTGEVETPKTIKEFIKQHNIIYKVANGEATNEMMYGLKSLNENGSIPFIVIFDKHGLYNESFVGMVSQDTLEKQIQEIMKEDK